MNVAVKEKLQNQKGFTIIEVVLVLAIAGLIFLMVFIALPALQSSQRDTARKNDASTIMSSVTTFTGNNRGTFPTDAQIKNYATNVSDNTTTVKVNGTKGAQTLTVPAENVIVTQSSQCGTVDVNGSVTLKSGTTRQFTVVTRLESGNNTGYCEQS
jgi:prepilin-type N-terminal cleavage/methylation domain-containing protein